MPRLLSIQYLRAFAAILVVIYHATRQVEPSFSIGAAGVDLFFVISGFILWTIASAKPVTWATFLRRRWARVAPLYWALTLIVAGLATLWPRLIWDAVPSWRHLLLSLAFIQHLNPMGLPFPIVSAGWSLNYEALFYLIFAANLVVPRKARLWSLTASLIAVPLFGIFVSRDAYFLGFNMMFFQFLAGVWLAEARFRAWLPSRRTGWVVASLGLAIFIVIYVLRLSAYESLWRPLIWGAPAFMIVAGIVAAEADGGFPDIPWLRFLGDASYSIYLAHFTGIQLFSWVMDNTRWSYPPVAVPLGIAAGVACYWFLERPLSRLFERRALAVLPTGTT